MNFKNLAMAPFFLPDDIVEFEPGRPVPDGRVCLVRKGRRYRARRVFREGEYYRLAPLNPHWEYKTGHVHIEAVEIFVISETSRRWLKERWDAHIKK